MARPPLVLASRSPQRRALLTQLRLPFRVAEPPYEEVPLPGAPEVVVVERSRGKARSVAAGPGDGPVLGVDTEVTLDGEGVLGKPADAADALRLLRALSGRPHRVVSGLTVVAGGREVSGHAVTEVRFRAVGERDLAAYVATGEWRGRAGGYAVQGVGAALVERIDGCYANVVGLPVSLLVEALSSVSYPVLAEASTAAPSSTVNADA